MESRSGSLRIQHLTSLSTSPEGRSRFPKLDECAHFHYETVTLGPLQLNLYTEDVRVLMADEGHFFHVQVTSDNKSWVVRRTFANFRTLDEQLHQCIYDRKVSGLEEVTDENAVPASSTSLDHDHSIRMFLERYLARLSELAGSEINCGPILNWLELDNRGRRLLVPDSCPINTPAVAAAYAVKRYQAQAGDEISFEVGDMISVIDMPPADESVWWRGKRGFSVGFFPCDCVAVIGDKVPPGLTNNTATGGLMTPHPTKPVLRKHGKLIAFFRSFILSRPSRRRLKQSGILKERVFGCDLGEHLLNSGHDVPMVLKCCTEFIESHGIVDGIYRLSGVTSNIQKLRHAFDEDRVPALYEDKAILHDIHSVSSLLKMYFRELPNPLCTYQLYNSFVAAVHGHRDKGHALACMRAAVRKLPPPHYRTLEYLMRHLCRVASHCELTGMTPRNIAIVWAPNLLRCRELEAAGLAALQGVGVQAVVTEFLVCYVDLIFSESMLPATPASSPASTITESISPIATSFPEENIEITPKRIRPKSLAISTPTKLLSLEEARNRALLSNLSKSEHEYIEVGGGPSKLPSKYHTVLDLPRKRSGSKRSPLGWRLLFGSKTGRKNSPRKQNNKLDDENNQQQLTGSGRVRVVKSVESLGSLTPSTSAQAIITDEPSLNNAGVASTILKTGQNSVGHSRSVSHDSYFDHLAETNQREEIRSNRVVNPGLTHGDSFLELSEIRLNFDLEERELGMFSLDEVLAQGSGSIFSNGSPRIQKPASSRSQMPEGQSMQALTPRARSEEPLNFSVSPIRQRGSTPAHHSNKYRLEDRLCWTELRYIDSQSPESKNSNQIELELTPTTASDDFSTPEQNYKPLTENTSSDNTTPDYENLVKLDVAGYKNLNNSITPSPNKEYSNNNFSINLVSDLMSDYEILMSRHKESNTLSPTLNIKIIYENVKTPTKQKEENVYEDVELRSEERDIYKDLKMLRRSVHEINELIDSESNIDSHEPSNLTQEHSSPDNHNSNNMLSQTESPQENHSPTIDLNITNFSSDSSLGSKGNITIYEDKTQEYILFEKDTDLKEDVNNQELLNNFETIGKVNIQSANQDLREDNDDISMSLENRDYENVKFDSQTTNITNSPVKKEIHILDKVLDKSVAKSNNDFIMETENIEHMQPLNLDENVSLNYSTIKQEQIPDYEIISFKSDNTMEKSGCSSCSEDEQKSSQVENTIMDLDFASDEQNESLGSRYSDQDESMHCSSSPDRRRIDSEIGRDILREKKTRLELDCLKSREKQESTRIQSKYEGFDHIPSVSRTSAISSKLARRYENTPFPPCVRARVAKNARKLANSTGLSISLDEKQFLDKGSGNLVRIQTSPDINTLKENRDPSEPKKTSLVDLTTDSTSYDINDDPGRRERIEKYKEERRNYLREKYRSESFRSSEKDELFLRLKQKSSKFSKEQTHLENETKLSKDQDHREKDNPSPTLSSKRRSHESRYLVRNDETFSFPKPDTVSIVTAKMSNLEKPECFSLTKDNKSKEETKSPICIKDITALFESKKDH